MADFTSGWRHDDFSFAYRHADSLVAGKHPLVVASTDQRDSRHAAGVAANGSGFLSFAGNGAAWPNRPADPRAEFGHIAVHVLGAGVGSVIYSMPFVVQPIQNAIEAVGSRPLEVAASLRASPWDAFWSVVVPLARPGFFTAAILGFAHTVGEFGLVLMIGGNIPDATRVVSVQIYDHVEALEYAQAHWLAAAMVMFSFLTLLLLYAINPPQRGRK